MTQRERASLAIVGAGAAGLMAAAWAGRARPGRGVVVLDGARTLGAKILVSGGGRYNVTHDVVDEGSFAGSSRPAIRKVLRRFDVARTIAFFGELGVSFKREETGKLFPVTDSARTVLDALLRATHAAGVRIRHPCRVETVQRERGGFVVAGAWGEMECERLVLAAGGRSLPKSGSDGSGHALARSMGHSLTPLIAPALVPLIVAQRCFVRELAGITLPATLEVRSGTGRRLATITGSTLCTHFGLSGPAVLDVSRHWLHAAHGDRDATLVVAWLPGETLESVDAALLALGRASAGRWLAQRLPDRLARALCNEAGVDASAPAATLPRERRRSLARAVAETVLPIVGDRGWAHAETTAGGVPLSEVRPETMESRCCPGLFLAGEMLDVDGRIGGYSFQWAWSSGHVAGVSA